MMTKQCVFCERPEIKERAIIQNNLAFSFPTNIPIVPGHILIVPNRCVANSGDLTHEEILAIFDLRKQLNKALIQAFDAEGFNYAWNEGESAGQAVPHFHLHMLPRKKGDKGIDEYEPRKFLYRPGSREVSPESELQSVTELIKKFIWLV